MKRKQLLPIFIALIVLAVSSMPSSKSSAQSDEADPDFIVTLALMAVADDRMDGVLDNSDLANIRELVDEYYEIMSNKKHDYSDEGWRVTLEAERSLILTALDQKINLINNNSTNAEGNFLRSFLGYDAEGYAQAELDERDLQRNVFRALSGKYEPSQKVIDLLNQKLATDEVSNIEKGLDGHTANTIEGGDQLIDTVYDFSAGLSNEARIDQLSQTKPLVFINNGARDVVVTVEYYAPPTGAALSAPGLNLTVPGGNSVTATGFPQGNYAFCADWQTDLDTDGDGLKDYDKMVTHTWLHSAHSDDPSMAEEVYVNSVGTVTPSGRCDGFKGEAPATETVMKEIAMTEDDPQQWTAAADPAEMQTPGEDIAQEVETDDGETGDEDNEAPPDADFWDQGDDSEGDEEPPGGTDPGGGTTVGGLTPEELSNQGQHNYAINCVYSDGDSNQSTGTSNWIFTENSVSDGASFTKVSPNNYISDYGSTLVFRMDGWTLTSFSTETSSEGETTTTSITCTAIMQ